MDEYVLREPGLANTRGSDDTHGPLGFAGTYETEIAIVDDPQALADHLNLFLTAGRMTDLTRTRIVEAISSVQFDGSEESAKAIVQLGVLATVNSPAFLVQR